MFISNYAIVLYYICSCVSLLLSRITFLYKCAIMVIYIYLYEYYCIVFMYKYAIAFYYVMYKKMPLYCKLLC